MLDGGPDRGLVEIDPYPCTGDPAFDAVDWPLWRSGSLDEIERKIELGAPAVETEPSRLRRWCEAFAAMSAVSLAIRNDRTPNQIEALVAIT